MYENLACVERGGVVESRHFGLVAVSDAEGRIIFAKGDPDAVVFPRSSFKPVQALGLVESGAFDATGLPERFLALACASHDGESIHSEAVGEWLEKMGLEGENLACGAAYPHHFQTKLKYYAGGLAPKKITHECSGKHCGFLATAAHLGHDARDYHLAGHPVQKNLRNLILPEIAEMRPEAIFWGVDGCRLPTPAFPVGKAALIMAKFSGCRKSPAKRKTAMERIAAAVSGHPEYVSGTENVSRKILSVLGNKITVKSGAEGFFVASLREKNLGIAVKLADGSHRASASVLLRTLETLKAITPSESETLAEIIRPPVLDSAGEKVGLVRPDF